MPYIIGVDEKRKAKLEDELNRIIALLPKYDVEKAYLIGSLARGEVSRISDIDLVIVKETNEKFVNRMNDFLMELVPKVGLDLLVYTPAEFSEMLGRSNFLVQAIKNGRVIYEK